MNEVEVQEGWKQLDSQGESTLLQHGLLLQLQLKCWNCPMENDINHC